MIPFDGIEMMSTLPDSSSIVERISQIAFTSDGRRSVNAREAMTSLYSPSIGGAASAAETALEYATMADETFFAMGEIETVGVFVPAPIFGGEGVPAPAFGVDQSSGNPVFTFSIGNAVKGAKYRIYRTESLTAPFEPYGDVIEADANGILDFVVPTADEPSCFFKIVTE